MQQINLENFSTDTSVAYKRKSCDKEGRASAAGFEARAVLLPIQVTSSLGFMPPPEREVVDPAREVLGLADHRDQLEVADALLDSECRW